jgi:hypothetical protein
VIRYFLQGRFGPWYEVDFDQWTSLNPRYEIGHPYQEITNHDTISHLLRAVYVDTSKALKADVQADFPGLQDLIWFPDMRCGDCNGRLIDLNENDPEKRYPNYAHATSVIDRHGAWPVERWDD